MILICFVTHGAEDNLIAEALGYEDYQDLYSKMEGIEEEED